MVDSRACSLGKSEENCARAGRVCRRVAKARTEVRVTPGRIVPSSGGVMRSKSNNAHEYLREGDREREILAPVVSLNNDKAIHLSHLSHLVFFPQYPQDLLIALLSCLALRLEAWSIVYSKLELTRSTGP